ncbi:MAG: hypothetical protein M1826_005438 [Phylliscum demangeonii]|nr:MAG: hypothetical protein M1826_005438 [Phylliscum demangeonii]
MMPAIPSFAATESPAASPAGCRISVEELFAAADKAGSFMGLSGPRPDVAVAAGAFTAITPPTLPPSANPAASPAGRRISVDDVFSAANKAGGCRRALRPVLRRLSVEDLFAAADKVGGFMGLSGPAPAVAVGSAGLVPPFPPVSRWASRWAEAAAAGSAPVAAAAAPAVAPVSRWAALWAQAAPAGLAPRNAVAAPVVAAAAFAALGASPPTSPATSPRSPTPPATTTSPTTTFSFGGSRFAGKRKTD